MTLEQRLDAVEGRISSTLLGLGRSRDEVTLVVVTKNHPVDLAVELYGLGVRDFGENRDQEAGPKASAFAQLVTESSPTWHFVGQLQSNKAKNVAAYADVVHSVDRESLLIALEKATAERPRPLDVFLQVNLTTDLGRGGVNPAELEPFAERVAGASGLNLLGIMAVAALDEPLESEFEKIAKLSQKLISVAPQAKFISAGMSQDFETALAYGATHLRIGTAITGKRNY
jgi:pyridoxal phosphate enzyme (YggS family)